MAAAIELALPFVDVPLDRPFVIVEDRRSVRQEVVNADEKAASTSI